MSWCKKYAWFEHEGKIISILELSDILMPKQTYSVGQIMKNGENCSLVRKLCFEKGLVAFLLMIVMFLLYLILIL